ncbi:hypothetical protein BH10PSE13_BH10PSE13_20150 [soil metagenome]
MSKIQSLLTGTKPALIINEMQQGNLKMFPALNAEVERRGVVANIAGLAAAFRAAGLPVFHAPAIHHPDLIDQKRNSMIANFVLKTKAMLPGTDDVKYLAGLDPERGDLVSARSSGLFALIGTDMNVRLRRMGVDTIVVTGVSTNLGIPALAMAGVDLAYHVIVPEDCIAASDQKVHEMFIAEQLRILANMTTSQDVKDALALRSVDKGAVHV